MSDPTASKVYQLKIHLIDVSPMVWRRLLVKDDTTIAQLHGIIQLAMGWENIHLHSFRIYGKAYGIYYSGGMSFSDDPREVRLRDFQFRSREKFYYDYNFRVNWQHQVRIEKVLDVEDGRFYPVCTGGKYACPPEAIESIEAFSEIRDWYKIPLYKLIPILNFQEYVGYPWHAEVFKRSKLNAWLKTENYDYMDQNDSFFPDRSRPYFEDAYWKRKDDFEAAKMVYAALKKEGIEVKDGYDALVKFLEPILEMQKATEDPAAKS